MNNALTLVRTADTLAAQTRQKHTRSPRQQEVTANLSLISRTWRTLSDQQRAGWTAFGQTWSPVHGKQTAKGIVVFQALNGVRLNSSQADILRDAPVQPDFIGKFPAVTVNATRISPALALSDAAPDTTTFLFNFVSPPFTGAVQVLATRPLSAGVTQPSPKDFRPIAFLPDITVGINDLSAAYMSQFPIPAAGMKVAVQIVPITPNGFKGNPYTQIATVVAAP